MKYAPQVSRPQFPGRFPTEVCSRDPAWSSNFGARAQDLVPSAEDDGHWGPRQGGLPALCNVRPGGALAPF